MKSTYCCNKIKEILIFCGLTIYSDIFAQNSLKIQDLRDPFEGIYHCANPTCVGPSADPSNLYYEVSKHPTVVDSMFIVDTLFSEGFPSTYKHRIKFNADSTWQYDSGYYGDFKKIDTLKIIAAPFYCGVAVTFFAKKIAPLGVFDYQGREEEYYIFPVPAKEDLHVYFPKIPGQLKVELYDATGKLQLQKTFIQSLQLDVGTLPRGVYFVKIKGDKINVNKKIVLTD